MPRQTTCERIARQAQRIARLELKLAKQKNHARRLDTRHKILLGGLVIKAKLDVLPLPVLLGGLLSLELQLCAEPGLLDVFRAKGEAVFLGFRPALSDALVLERRRVTLQEASNARPGNPSNSGNSGKPAKQSKNAASHEPFFVTEPSPSSLLPLTASTGSLLEARLAALKQATRHKIQLGGLVLKANLGVLSKAQLLGALVTLADTVIRCPAVIEDYRVAGELALAAPHIISTASPHLPLPSRSSPQGLPPSLPLVSCAAHDAGSQ